MSKVSRLYVENIYQIYEDLSSREQQLADFILDAPGDIAMYPAKELARRTGVSNSTVSRFVQRLGYDNYEQMRVAARQARHWGAPQFSGSHLHDGDAATDPVTAFLKAEQEALGRSLASLTPELLDGVAQALADARQLGFLGFRNSYYIAGYARGQFIQFRSGTRLLPGPGETLAERIADLGPSDVVVAVAVRRVVSRVETNLRALNEKGVRILLLTDPSARVIPKYATWTIFCQVQNDYMFDSYAGVMAILRLLACEAFRKSGKAGREYMHQVEQQHGVLSELDMP